MAADHLGGSRDIGTLVHGERQVLEMIATGAPLASVLDELCRVIDERSHLMSAVFLLDDSGKHLTYIAGPHVPDLWRQVVSAAPLPVTGAGACGTAVTRHEQVVVPDLAVDPTYQQSFREVARTVGIHAAWSTPFYAKDHRVLGTFAVYSPAIGPPNALDLELVARATHLASVAVEHHQTEASLRESERRFSTVFYANAAAMSIARTADGRFLYVNDRFVTLYGHSREDVIGQTALSLGLYEDPSQRYDLLAQVLGRGRAQDFEARARTKTADVLEILIWAERIQLLGEDCILAITLEHTDRKRAEEALRRSEGLLRQVLDALPVGVAVVDRSGDVIRTNPASTRIWGRSIESGRERYAKSKGWWHDSGERVAPDEWASVRAVPEGHPELGRPNPGRARTDHRCGDRQRGHLGSRHGGA